MTDVALTVLPDREVEVDGLGPGQAIALATEDEATWVLVIPRSAARAEPAAWIELSRVRWRHG